MQLPDPSLKLVGAERRLMLWFACYAIGLFGVAAFLGGSVVLILSVIGFFEVLFLLWQPTPKLGPASYNAPTPAGWQTPIRVMRWYEIINGCWSIGCGAVLFTVILGFILVAMRPSTLGPSNFAVLLIFGGWLATRPLWSPPLRKWARRQTADITKQLAGGSAVVRVGTHGLDIDLHMTAVGAATPQRNWVFSVGFAELSEVRTLGANEAQAYSQSMEQYDPTVGARAAWELYQFVEGKVTRPSIFGQLSFGTHLLVRGPTVLYLIGNGDEFGPAAVAAWQAWQARHAVPTTPLT
jgi:hypothetical protein